MTNKQSSPPSLSSDAGNKLLFSFPEMVRDLLIGYAPGEWIKDADFSSLIHVSGSYVSETGRQRYQDVVWRVDVGGQCLWVYIVLECQRQPEKWMALRMLEYVNQLSLQITRDHKKHKLPEGRLPPILPIVLYDGKSEWNAATDVVDCFIKPPDGLEAFQPRLRYLLLDIHRLKRSRTKKNRNFAEAVFRMEANRGKEEVFTVIRELAEMLNAPGLKSLRRALNVWTKNLLLRYATDSKITDKISNTEDVFEGHDMIEAVYTDWDDAARQEGEQKGEAKLLLRQLSHRFGPLPKWAATRVSKAKSEQLENWATAVFDASSLTDVIGTPKASARK